MADHPILFSGQMVRALLAGKKTQTRRVLKGAALAAREPEWEAKRGEDGVWRIVADTKDVCGTIVANTRIAFGDRLWVRETWTARMTNGWTIADARSRMYQEELLYQADGVESIDGWWPSIHMPRAFSRLTLTVTDVRVERLQDCSAADAIAEGIRGNEFEGWFDYSPGEKPCDFLVDPRQSYRTLWNSINGKGAWQANPWVAAYTFTVEPGNIDRFARAA